jgi:hypothetical protein
VRAWLALGLLVLPIAAGAQTRGVADGSAGAGWSELPALSPKFPKPEDYLPLQVKTTTSFAFFVDAKSISVGKDGVVRYSLIAKSTEGVINVSYEGIRCSTREYRVFAYGRPDNTWSEARIGKWQPLPTESRNTQRTTLESDFFCPAGRIIDTPEEGEKALAAGMHPRAIFSGR